MMSTSTVLLISSDRPLIEAVEESAPAEGCAVEAVEEIELACSRVERDDVAMVIVHLDHEVDHGNRVQGVSRLLQSITAARLSAPTLVVSDDDNPEQTLAFLRLGVAEFLSRPLDLNRLAYLLDVLTIRARYDRRRIPAAPAPAKAADPEIKEIWVPEEELPFFFATGTKMERLMEQIRRIAPQDTTILLGGATGTGKSRLAGVIHRLSPRRDEPILTINCGALSATLIESEMFGHIKGAFTGADSDRVGKFAAAGRGTLFLDEVDSLPLSLQAKLLRAVEERVFEPVGSNKTQKMQARLIAACNRPLDQEVAAGRFRADLYYRLNVVAFELPPLRERVPAIPSLARIFMEDFASKGGRHLRGIEEKALRALRAYPWPGNIRELRNVIERAVALCPGPLIGLDDLPDGVRELAREEPAAAPPTPTPATRGAIDTSLARSREQAERMHIIEALRKHGNNRLRAAAELGISRMTLYNKLRKFGITDLAL